VTDGPAARVSVAEVAPQLRSPGTVLGPRANRTIASILDATRRIFLVKGYAGTTIDEITTEAGVSRGSFYTYFPSKRDVLLALGANSLSAASQLIKELADLGPDWKPDDLAKWTRSYFDLLEEHGAFAFGWTQAAHEDDEIRRAGMRGHLPLCRQLGMALHALAAPDATVGAEDPTAYGLITVAMLERAWSYAQLYGEAVDTDVLTGRLAEIISAIARPRPR